MEFDAYILGVNPLEQSNQIFKVSRHARYVVQTNLVTLTEMINARPFFYFCLMQQLLRVICPNSNWTQRFSDLLDTFPTTDSNAVSLNDMGIVNDWTSWAIWQ